MDEFMTLLAQGIANGAIVGLVALGIVLLQNATGVINFAQGDLMTLAAYFGSWLLVSHNFAQIPMFIAVFAIMFVIGIALERVGYAPLRKRNPLVILVSTFALGMAIRALIFVIWGDQARGLPSPWGNKVAHILGATVTYQNILIIVVTGVVGTALLMFFRFTPVGRQVRALAIDRETALLQGIRARSLSPIIFGLSAALAGLAGVLVAPNVTVTQTLGFNMLLPAFAAVILGGERLEGAVAAAMAISIAQIMLTHYVASNYQDAYPFIFLVVVLAIRPNGLVRMVSGVRY